MCVMSVLTYETDTWTSGKKDKDKLNAFEMNIRWQQKIRNKELMTGSV